MPRNAAEAKGLLLASIREPDPVVFFEPKVLYRTSVEDVPNGDYEIPLGVADVMQEGADVTVVSQAILSKGGRGRTHVFHVVDARPVTTCFREDEVVFPMANRSFLRCQL